MPDTRKKDVNWAVADPATGYAPSWECVSIAVLMDIRDEMKRLNNLLECPNFLQIPAELSKIRKNTEKPRKVK